MQTVADDRAWVGGTLGILAVLHTWSRTLEYHPHAHLLVTAGGLSADGTAWVRPAHRRFLLPGYVLSRIFRAKMREALTRAGLEHEVDARVWERRWTVHVQQIGTGQHATLYLSRYVYRVALTNQRLARFTDGRVTFRYTHARTHEPRSATLPVHAFLARFLEHVLPRGFTKIRWYGLLSPGRRKDLERARQLLALHSSPQPASSQPSHAESPTDSTLTTLSSGSTLLRIVALRCPICRRGQRILVRRYHRSRAPP